MANQDRHLYGATGMSGDELWIEALQNALQDADKLPGLKETDGEGGNAPAGEDAETAEKMNREALRHLAEGRTADAEACWEKALAAAPDDPAAVYNQGLYLWRDGRIGHTELISRCASATGGDWEQARRRQMQISCEATDTAPRYADLPEAGNHAAKPYLVAVSADGERVYTFRNSELRCLQGKSDEEIYTDWMFPPRSFDAMLLTADRKKLVLQNGEETDNTVIRDAETGKELRVMNAGGSGIVLHPDSRHFFDISRKDGRIRKWDMGTGEAAGQFAPPAGWDPIRRKAVLAVCPDGTRLYACCDNVLSVWNTAGGGLPVSRPAGIHISDMRISPDGKMIYTCGSAGVSFGKTDETGLEWETPAGQTAVFRIWLSPDGKKLLAADRNKVLRLWDTETRRSVRARKGHERKIGALDACGDLSTIVTASPDGCMAVWQWKNVRTAPWETGEDSTERKPDNGNDETIRESGPVKPSAPDAGGDETVREPGPVKPPVPDAGGDETVREPGPVKPSAPDDGSDETVREPGPVMPAAPDAGGDETVREPGPVRPAAPDAGSDETVREPGPAMPDKPAPAAELRREAEKGFEKGTLLSETYRIESDAMMGGMGSVWRVHHNRWNTDLAMKRPQAKLFMSRRDKEGFTDECRNWIGLGLHPNIVSCYYIREINGVPTIFSEWMENGSLESRIRDSSLYAGTDEEAEKRILDVAIQFARGLGYAHRTGLIHQDVKPDNLLLTENWQAKVADFGLAGARKMLSGAADESGEAGETRLGAHGGYTPAYCSPEQATRRTLTLKTDIYSWGVSVMEMLIGERPWTNGVVAGIACRDYLAHCRIGVPERLKALLIRCMAQEPDERPGDFTEVCAEMKEIFREETGNEYPRPEPKAAPDTADSLNNRALSYLDMNMPEEAEKLWQEARFADPSNAEALYNAMLHEYREGKCSFGEVQDYLGQISKVNDQGYVYSAWLGLEHGGQEGYHLAARIAAIQNDPELVEDLKRTDREGHFSSPYALSRVKDIAETEAKEKRYDSRAAEIRNCLDNGDDAEASLLMAESINPANGFTECIYRPEWMALNDRLSRRGCPYYMRVAFPLMSIREAQFTDPLSFTRDSSRFMCGGRVYDTRTGSLIADRRAPGKARYSSVSPDGTFFLRAGEDDREIRKIAVSDGSILERFGGFDDPVNEIALSPDGTAVAGISRSGGLRIWQDGELVRKGSVEGDLIRNLQIDSRNRYTAFSVDNDVCIVCLDNGKVQKIKTGLNNLLNFAMSRDFSQMLLCGDREGFILYDRLKQKILRHDTPENKPMRVRNVAAGRFLPNDRYITYSSIGEVYGFGPQEYEWILGYMAGHSLVTNIVFSPNWKYMAFNCNDDMVRLMRCAYIYYMPPKKGTGEETHRQYMDRFNKAMSGHEADEKRIGFYHRIEEAFSDREVAGSFAAVMRKANPGKGTAELLPAMMEELRDRGFGNMEEETVLELLEENGGERS